ncbi:MAG: hypothetical protein HC897_02465 [Thermoanaerobaculia bacterium]|nr:hypothetical protein [Thermoanaerobaculia bacterium]
MTARVFLILCSLLLALPLAAEQYLSQARALAAAVADQSGDLTRQIRGSETHQFTYDPLGMPKYLQSTTDQAQVYHFHPDHLGTPRQITNASGVQVALHSYYPFGQEATDPAQTAFTKKFTGHERDANGTGTAGDLDYMHARYCSPTLGRFLSFDPIGGNPRAPQSWNRYAYALNSPMNYTDPEGLFAQLFLDLYFVVFDEITVTGRHALWSFSDTINLRALLGWAPEFNFERQTTGQLQYAAARGGELEGYALGRDIEVSDDEVVEFGLSLGTSTALSVVKVVASRAVQPVAKATVTAILKKTMRPDHVALKELVDEATQGGRKVLSREDAETVLDWAFELNYPGTRAKAGDVSTPSNWGANPVPHIHLPHAGRKGHIPVEAGVTPRH